MGDTEQDAIDALRAAGLEKEARAVEALRAAHRKTLDSYHAGQRSSYESGVEYMRETCIDIVALHGGSVEIEAAIRRAIRP